MQQEMAAHNRRATRIRWLLGLGAVGVILIAIIIFG